MANDISSNPWRLDTAGVAFDGQVRIQTIQWVLPTTQGDDLILKDANGHIILETKAETALGSQIFQLDAWYKGVTVDTIDTGSVLIHIN